MCSSDDPGVGDMGFRSRIFMSGGVEAQFNFADAVCREGDSLNFCSTPEASDNVRESIREKILMVPSSVQPCVASSLIVSGIDFDLDDHFTFDP